MLIQMISYHKKLKKSMIQYFFPLKKVDFLIRYTYEKAIDFFNLVICGGFGAGLLRQY